MHGKSPIPPVDRSIRYSFTPILTCNFCASPSEQHKVLGKRLNRSQGKNPRTKTGITTTVVRCSTCGLIYSNPLPIPNNILDHYGIPPEAYWKESYFIHDESYFQQEIKKLSSLLPFRKGMRSLDIGAGLGKAMLALEKAGFESYGFEPSLPFYERAISKMGVSSQRLQLGSIETVEYPSNSFDFISFGAVLEHLYDPSASVLRALEWLKPQGIVHLEVPSSDWLIHKLVNLYYRLIGTDYVGNLSPMHEPYHLYEFSLQSFERHAQQHGYELAASEYYVCQTYMPKLLDVFLKPYMQVTQTGMQLCVWLRKK